MRRASVIMFLLVLLAGCGVSRNVQNRLEEGKGALTYLHDSIRPQQQGPATVAVRSFAVDDVLPARTTVRSVDSSVLPLLVYNTWTEEMRAQLGYASIENDYKRALREHFLAELRRSGRFAYREGAADLAVTVRVRKVEISAPVRHRGTFFFFLFIFGGGAYYSAGPAVATVTADVSVERAGSQVMSGTFSGKHATNILEGRDVRLDDFTVAMIEAVSLAVKDLNERIVNALNRVA